MSTRSQSTRHGPQCKKTIADDDILDIDIGIDEVNLEIDGTGGDGKGADEQIIQSAAEDTEQEQGGEVEEDPRLYSKPSLKSQDSRISLEGKVKFRKDEVEEVRLLPVGTLITLLVQCWRKDPFVMGVKKRLERNMHPVSQLLLCMILVVVVGVAVGLVACGYAYLISQADYFGDARGKTVILLIMGSIFTAWNIAQYASFTIQTTGHFDIFQHIRSIMRCGPYILAPNLLGWAMAFVCAFVFEYDERHILLYAGLIIVPAVVLGIFSKTYCKLKYFVDRAVDSTVEISDPDTLGMKVKRVMNTDIALPCPFKKITPGLLTFTALQPTMCFVWTIGMGPILKIILLEIWKLPGGRAGTEQCIGIGAVFFFCYTAQEAGHVLLQKSIASAKGIMFYQQRMIMAFFLIYCTITEALVCFCVVSAEGTLREILTIARPLLECAFRHREYCATVRAGKKLEKLHADKQINAEYEQLDLFWGQKVISLVTEMLVNTIVPIAMSGMACVFTAETGLDMQSDCEDGFFMVALNDVGPGWVFMIFEMIIMQFRYRIPMIHYFTLLIVDPFLLVCVLVVIYLMVAAIALTAAIGVTPW